MTNLELCRKVAEVWGLKIQRDSITNSFHLLEDDGRCNLTHCGKPALPEVCSELASRVERETDPKKIERTCKVWWERRGGWKESWEHLPRDCKYHAEDLARILREAKDEPVDSVSSDDLFVAGLLNRSTEQGVKRMIDKAIAEHETKMHSDKKSEPKNCKLCNNWGGIFISGKVARRDWEHAKDMLLDEPFCPHCGKEKV